MILIIGGAFQGKGEYARNEFGEDVYDCRLEENRQKLSMDTSHRIIDGLETFVRTCTEEGVEAADYLKEHRGELSDSIILCDDISQGLVPMDATERAWREMTGRALIYLSAEADRVVRIFCGIPQVLKG